VAPGSKSSRKSRTISLSGHHGATIPRAEELFRELEQAIEAGLAEARDRLAELMRGAVAGYVRRAYVNCGKPGCRKCPHGPYPQFKEPGGNWRSISEDEYGRLLMATERWREARRVERQIERAERLWLKARELLDEALGILEALNGGDSYGEDD